jgi:hypothetical protein
MNDWTFIEGTKIVFHIALAEVLLSDRVAVRNLGKIVTALAEVLLSDRAAVSNLGKIVTALAEVLFLSDRAVFLTFLMACDSAS